MPQDEWILQHKQKERIVDTAISIIGKGNLPFTTGTNLVDNQKIQYIQDWLGRISQVMLHIHKLHIKTSVDKENYGILTLPKRGNAKAHFERIGHVNGPHNVEYRIYANGTIMIYISCSEKPFRLFYEEDISTIMVFLGRVEDRLRYLLSDTRDMVVPPVGKWILNSCDVNKDVEINGMAHLALPGLRVSLAEKAFRAYVKQMGNKAYYRFEQLVNPNETINASLENLRTNTDLDKSFQLLG